MARAFISYKNGAEPDEGLAEYFAQNLMQKNHRIFIDKKIEIGQEWPTVIKQELEQAEALIVLLSEHAITSEMIIEEVAIAHQLKKQRGTPIILPVRLAYIGDLPYDLGAMLGRIQYAFWAKAGDEVNILERMHQALVTNQPFQEKPTDPQNEQTIALATDGNETQPDKKLISPLPAFDPRWLEKLDSPGGAIRLQSPFYIERQVDKRTKDLILKDGLTLRIKGSRQMGKSSILARLYQHARDQHRPVLYIDFQRFDDQHLQDIEIFLRHLAELIAYKLQTTRSPDHYWQTPLGPKDKLTEFLSSEILVHAATPLVLLLDEVDRLFDFAHCRDDFFGLLRSWHNNRAFEPLWDKLNLVLAYSTEAFMFIADLNQSPFNIGEAFEVNDLDHAEVEELNRRHGSPLKTEALDDMMELLHGHPFLTRKAFYDVVTEKLSFPILLNRATDDDGPFGDHLRRYLWHFNAQPEVSLAMKAVIQNQACPTDQLFYQLRSAGLVLGNNRNHVKPRCGLYARYFARHL